MILVLFLPLRRGLAPCRIFGQKASDVPPDLPDSIGVLQLPGLSLLSQVEEFAPVLFDGGSEFYAGQFPYG